MYVNDKVTTTGPETDLRRLLLHQSLSETVFARLTYIMLAAQIRQNHR